MEKNNFDVKSFFKTIQVGGKGSVELNDGMVTEPLLKIVNSARVSFLKNSTELEDKDLKLIRFLMEHEHNSTLRHSYFTFAIKAPLFVFRQWWKYQVGSSWEENESGAIIIPETNWNEACLAGNSTVWGTNRTKYRICELAEWWDDSAQKHKVLGLKIRTLNEQSNLIVTNTIKDVIRRGNQEVYEVVLQDGKSIRCTKSHKLFTSEGWKTMGEATQLSKTRNLKVATVLGAEPKFQKIASVRYLGSKECFDLEMEGINKNFVCDGIIVHNSGRYVSFEPEFYIPENIRVQSKVNKQGSQGTLEKLSNGEDPVQFYHDACMRQYADYKYMIESGAAKEQCRGFLPQNIYSSCYWTCSLQTILFFLHQRLKSDAQFEIQEYARAVWDLLSPMIDVLGEEEWK